MHSYNLNALGVVLSGISRRGELKHLLSETNACTKLLTVPVFYDQKLSADILDPSPPR